MKMMKAAVALGMALTMTVTGASAVFAEGETLSVATDFEIKTLVPWAASEENAFLVLNQAEEGLFRMDENNQPQPALCDAHEAFLQSAFRFSLWGSEMSWDPGRSWRSHFL